MTVIKFNIDPDKQLPQSFKQELFHHHAWFLNSGRDIDGIVNKRLKKSDEFIIRSKSMNMSYHLNQYIEKLKLILTPVPLDNTNYLFQDRPIIETALKTTTTIALNNDYQHASPAFKSYLANKYHITEDVINDPILHDTISLAMFKAFNQYRNDFIQKFRDILVANNLNKYTFIEIKQSASMEEPAARMLSVTANLINGQFSITTKNIII